MATDLHLVMVPASAVPVHTDGRRLLLFLATHFFRSPARPLLDGRRDWKLTLEKKFGDAVLASVRICLLCCLYVWHPCHGEDEIILLLLLLS